MTPAKKIKESDYKNEETLTKSAVDDCIEEECLGEGTIGFGWLKDGKYFENRENVFNGDIYMFYQRGDKDTIIQVRRENQIVKLLYLNVTETYIKGSFKKDIPCVWVKRINGEEFVQYLKAKKAERKRKNMGNEMSLEGIHKTEGKD